MSETVAGPAIDESAVRLAVVVGSTREGRVGDNVAAWFAEQARRRDDLDVAVLDLVEFAMPSRYPDVPTSEMRAFSTEIDKADAYVLVTPEYNRSFPASLKQAIDAAYDEWHAKPAAVVSYGYVAGGVFAAEALRSVLTELHVVTVRTAITLSFADGTVAEDGTPTTADHLSVDVARMLDQLVWWARALREARARRPYLS